jgi:hypothetical protein
MLTGRGEVFEDGGWRREDGEERMEKRGWRREDGEERMEKSEPCPRGRLGGSPGECDSPDHPSSHGGRLDVPR